MKSGILKLDFAFLHRKSDEYKVLLNPLFVFLPDFMPLLRRRNNGTTEFPEYVHGLSSV
jgi:hypothetical protein